MDRTGRYPTGGTYSWMQWTREGSSSVLRRKSLGVGYGNNWHCSELLSTYLIGHILGEPLLTSRKIFGACDKQNSAMEKCFLKEQEERRLNNSKRTRKRDKNGESWVKTLLIVELKCNRGLPRHREKTWQFSPARWLVRLFFLEHRSSKVFSFDNFMQWFLNLDVLEIRALSSLTYPNQWGQFFSRFSCHPLARSLKIFDLSLSECLLFPPVSSQISRSVLVNQILSKTSARCSLT